MIAKDTSLFAVIDLETTGFSPRRKDRVVEIAIVSLDAECGVVDEYNTLVNPERDLGPSYVHGISPLDVANAPAFREIAGDVVQWIDGRVIVAHNLPFDLGFLTSEFEQLRLKMPTLVTLCTLELAFLLEPQGAVRQLTACCERAGIAHIDSHAALGDAQATAQLLSEYRRLARERGITKIEEMFEMAIAYPKRRWTGAPLPCGRRLVRQEATSLRAAQRHYLAQLAQRLRDEVSSAEEASYLNLLDKVLEDRQITLDEADILLAEAERMGLPASQAFACHYAYLASLVRRALDDGVVSDAEHRDLSSVARLLGIEQSVLDDLLRREAN